MVVYIEYALLENFLLDGILLCLSFKAARRKIRFKNLLFAALFGAIFALFYPLFSLPKIALLALKIAVGAWMCLLAFGRLKNKNEGGRYAFVCVCFFVFSFLFAGALTFLGVGAAWTALFFCFFAMFTLVLLRKLRAKRAENACLYDCTIAYKQRERAVLGFYDSGNLATYKNAPVCFLSPELIFELWEEEIFEGSEGQVCDEMKIQTLSGEKTTRLYKGGLEIKTKEGKTQKKEVYFALSANMLSREYKLLLNSRIFEEEQ